MDYGGGAESKTKSISFIYTIKSEHVFKVDWRVVLFLLLESIIIMCCCERESDLGFSSGKLAV